MIEVHGENKNIDYMLKFDKILTKLENKFPKPPKISNNWDVRTDNFIEKVEDMNLEEMKKKFKSGEYVIIFKQKILNKWDKCYRPNDLTWRNDFDYKLIHKKHKDILDAYLEDNSVEIEISTGGWHTIEYDWIEGYNENNEYRLREAKPKNNFEEYGFSGEFEGEILKKVGSWLIGYVVDDDEIMTCQWDLDGSVYDFSDFVYQPKKYKLKLLKKPWYEDESNFPCLVYIKSINDTRKAFKFEDNMLHCQMLVTNINNCRPATKEEILSLLVEK